MSIKTAAVIGAFYGACCAIIILMTGCTAHRTLVEQAINKSACYQQEACVVRMVGKFNLTDLKKQPGIESASTQILAFQCTPKASIVVMRVSLKGQVQGQCLDASILIEGVIECNPTMGTCQITPRSSTYERLGECEDKKIRGL